jgi:hypothetical protein
MSKKKDKAESSLRPEVSRELDKIKLAKKKVEKIKTDSWPRQEKIFEQFQQTRIKDIERKALKDEDSNKHRKADKKIGGVRGKFHPSLERTRKRT